MSTPNASGWKPGTPVEGHNAMSGPDTATGNRALMLEEPLLFEIGHVETTGVDLPEPGSGANRLGGFERSEAIGLPGLSEPETVRHYTRLSRQNYAIDLGLFPLGSCTMKHNPRLNEKIARMPGFADVHPLQPVDTVRGALEALAADHAMRFAAPPPRLCTDNAAMIAWAGIERLGQDDPLDISARPRWPLDPEAEPVRGAGVKA